MSMQPANRLHRQGRFSRQRGHRTDARHGGGVSGRPGRRPRLAVSARRCQPRRTGRRGTCFASCKEEIGLERRDVEVLGSTRGWLRYRLPRQYVRDRCIGQKQRWFLLKLIGDESKLRFDSTASPSSIDGAGPTTGRRCARSCISSGGFTCGRCTIWAKLMFPEGLPPYPEWWPEIHGERLRRARRP